MVYKMIEKQSKTVYGPFHHYPECQMAQYILPCFVATLIDMDKDPNVSKESTLKYMHFLHEFISCYEQYEFVQVQKSLVKLTSYMYEGEGDIAEELLWDVENSKNAFHKELENASAIKMAHRQGLQYLMEARAQRWLFKLDSFRGTVWVGHMPMLFGRIRNTLVKMGWMEVNSLNMCYTISKICFQLNSTKSAFDLLKVLKYRISTPEATKRLPKEYMTKIAHGVRKDYALLSNEQITALIIFHALYKFQKQPLHEEQLQKMQGPKFAFDTYSVAYWSILENDMWKIKKLIGPCVRVKNSSVDTSMVTVKQARKNQCYNNALKILTPEGNVPMSKLGEMTFYPIQHCRWCGYVNAKVFRLCPECKDDPEYPDMNYFCSAQCEATALDAQHREEHARDFMIRLSILN